MHFQIVIAAVHTGVMNIHALKINHHTFAAAGIEPKLAWSVMIRAGTAYQP